MEEELDKEGMDYMIQQAIKEVIAEKIKNGLLDIRVVNKNLIKNVIVPDTIDEEDQSPNKNNLKK